MSEEVIEQPKRVVAFGRRNANEDRIKKAEQELEELTKESETVTVTAEDSEAEPESAEEKTFKKRYGDLRRHSQKQQDELQNQINELRTQLEKATAKEIKLPKTEEELQSWASEYPDVYKIIETIAIKKAQEQSSSFEERLRKVDEMERNAARDKAEAELMRLHPDFNDIRDQDEFHEWVEEQPDWVQKALYENETDARSAARAIDLYKADKQIKAPKKSSDKEAAMAFGTKSAKTTPSKEGSEDLIYESQVAKMTTQQYEQYADEIAKAIKSGKFVYDMSGNAR